MDTTTKALRCPAPEYLRGLGFGDSDRMLWRNASIFYAGSSYFVTVQRNPFGAPWTAVLYADGSIIGTWNGNGIDVVDDALKAREAVAGK